VPSADPGHVDEPSRAVRAEMVYSEKAPRLAGALCVFACCCVPNGPANSSPLARRALRKGCDCHARSKRRYGMAGGSGWWEQRAPDAPARWKPRSCVLRAEGGHRALSDKTYTSRPGLDEEDLATATATPGPAGLGRMVEGPIGAVGPSGAAAAT
jgi:hypothetical protein